MKRSLIILVLIATALVIVFFVLNPQTDTASPQPIFHFYIVTFISLAAAVVSILWPLRLAFCRLAVEVNGGHIAALDAPETGSLFTFTLPHQQNP